MIIILDGWGEQIADEFNGINVAPTPTMDELRKVVFVLLLKLYRD